MMRLLLLFFVLLTGFGPSGVRAQTDAQTDQAAGQVTVAAASNVVEPLEQIAALFTARTGHEVRIINGSTGKLYAQILRGAPFDLFLAADRERPALLVEAGLTEGPARTYARGRLALWSRNAEGQLPKDKDTSANPDAMPGQDLKDRLISGAFNRLAIADPALAPYGLAASAVLKALGLEEVAADRLVLGENIGQTFAFVATGNAELGLVALSQLRSPRLDLPETWWTVPADLHDPIRQDAVLLKAAQKTTAALAFHRFLFDTEARAVLEAFGYEAQGD